MTACFLFSAAGSESPSFNYFRNFADPVSVLLCQRKWDLQQRPLRSHSRLRFIQNAKIYQTADFYKILLTFHLLSFSHPRSQQLLHSQSPGPPPEENSERWITKQPHSTSLSPLSLSPSLSDLVLTQQGLFRSKQPEVTLLSVTPSYPGHGPGSRETHSAGSRGHKAQINRDEGYIWSLHRSLACTHQGQASFSRAARVYHVRLSTASSDHGSPPQRSRFSV